MPSWRAARWRLDCPGIARSLRMRCSAPGWVKAFQTSAVNAPGPPRAARGWARPLMPCRTRMPALRAAAARASTGTPVSAAMSLRLRWRSWYCSRSQCGSMPPSGGGAGWRSSGAGEELPDGALAASGDAGDLARAVSLAGEVAELFGAGWFRLGRGRRGDPGGKLGRRVAGCCQPDVVGAGGEPGGDGADGQAGADERVQVFGPDGVGVRAGPGDAGGPVERGFPGDGLADACLGEQCAGLLVQAEGQSARAW